MLASFAKLRLRRQDGAIVYELQANPDLARQMNDKNDLLQEIERHRN